MSQAQYPTMPAVMPAAMMPQRRLSVS